MKLTIDVKQRGQNNEEKKNNSCAAKKSITGFYTEDEPSGLNVDPYLLNGLLIKAFDTGSHLTRSADKHHVVILIPLLSLNSTETASLNGLIKQFHITGTVCISRIQIGNLV